MIIVGKMQNNQLCDEPDTLSKTKNILRTKESETITLIPLLYGYSKDLV